MKTALKLGAAALLIGGFVTTASAQVYGVPGVDYGYPPYPTRQAPHARILAPLPSEQVFENGKLIGQDPDANVRMMLRKDFTFE